MMRKLLLTTIILALIAALLACCSGRLNPGEETDGGTGTAGGTGQTGGTGSAGTIPQETSGGAFEEKDILLFSDGKIHLTLVRPEKSTQTENDQFRELHLGLSSLSGGAPTLTTDEQYRGHTYDAEAAELLMGSVSYPEVLALLFEISYDEYAVGAVGNKLVVAAWADAALPYAVSAFLSYAKENTVNGSLTLPAGFRLVKTCPNPLLRSLSDVPGFPGGKTEAVSDCSDGFVQITVSETDAAMFTEYRTTLADSGYTLHSENAMGENLFVTYTKSTKTVYAYHVPYSGTTRIVASQGALLPEAGIPDYTKSAECSFTLFGLETGGEAGGLGCMMQLEDGSFVIVDGGHNTSIEAAQIYQKMFALAPDTKNIVIRAWVITHAHGDHYGALLKFASAYGKSGSVKVESFIFNFCDTAEQTRYMSDGTASCAKVRNVIKTTYPNSRVYKCLTGQVFHFAGADMEILNCMSDFLPGVIGLERGDADLNQADGNIQSIVVRFITTAEKSQSVMVTGDVSKVSVDEMCARFGEYLKSDMLTVPHHGWNENRYRARNGTVEFYEFVDPTVVLWPDGVAAQAKKLLWQGAPGGNWEANYYLLNSLHVKKTIVAGSTTVTLVLPYEA